MTELSPLRLLSYCFKGCIRRLLSLLRASVKLSAFGQAINVNEESVMIELTEAVQQMLDRTTVQVVQESSRQVSSVLTYDSLEKDGIAAPWVITWDTQEQERIS